MDFLDVDRIRTSGLYSDAAILDMIRERDLGFILDVFVQQLQYVNEIKPYQVSVYGVDDEQLKQVKARFNEWIERLKANR